MALERLTLAVAVASIATCRGAFADDAAPPVAAAPLHPFVAWVDEIEPGTPIHVSGLTLVPLVRMEALQQPLLDLHVGLRGARLSWLDLPEPGGDVYVRLTNLGDVPVEITVGEALITPGGPSRVVTRPAWVGPHTATLVSVTQPTLPAPAGPYQARGLGLSPREQELLETDRWGPALAERNNAFAVDPLRMLDATAAYLTDDFQALAASYEDALRALAAPTVVGVVAFDERGAAYARIYGGAVQFQKNLPFLVPEFTLDALQAARANRVIPAVPDPIRRDQARTLMGRLSAAGVTRASFGGCALHRWLVLDRGGRWEGLSVDGQPVSLTWRHKPPPPPQAPAPPAPAPPPPPQPPPEPPATPSQVERDPRPTVEDARRVELREKSGSGGARPTPPAGGGGLGGLPAGGSGGGSSGGGLGGGGGGGGGGGLGGR